MTKRTIRAIILVLMLVTICLYFVSGTYARYASSATGSATATVAKWAVKLNGTDITTSSTALNVTFTEVTNDNVVDGKIAPDSELYTQFSIDPTGSEVAIDYTFELGEITASTGTVPSGLEVSKVVLVNGTNETEIAGTNGTYTGTIALTSQSAALTSNDAITVKVYVEWTNNDSNNDTDTSVGATAPTLTMSVDATVQQHIG